MTVSDQHGDHSDEIYEMKLLLVHGDGARFVWEAQQLHEAGFELVEVIGLDDVLWKKEGLVFTTKAAMYEIGLIDAELVEHGFSPVQIVGTEDVVWQREEKFYTEKEAMETIEDTEEDA